MAGQGVCPNEGDHRSPTNSGSISSHWSGRRRSRHRGPGREAGWLWCGPHLIPSASRLLLSGFSWLRICLPDKLPWFVRCPASSDFRRQRVIPRKWRTPRRSQSRRSVLSENPAEGLRRNLLEVEPGLDTECSGLIGQEADTGPGPPLPIERQERDLVSQVVDEERDVPSASPNTCAQVEQVV